MSAPPAPSILHASLPRDALRSAATFLRRGVRPDGNHEDGSEWEINSHQWGMFISWAYNRGVALPATVAPNREGGREHDLRFDAAESRWLKFTKPFAAGDTVELIGGRLVRRPASPLAYLQRWRLTNRLFNDDVRLVGLSCFGRTQRLVISQPHRTGEPPTWEQIDRTLRENHGLRPLPSSVLTVDVSERRAYGRGRLVVFDVCPANAARQSDGRVAFFDVLAVLLNRAAGSKLNDLLLRCQPSSLLSS